MTWSCCVVWWAPVEAPWSAVHVCQRPLDHAGAHECLCGATQARPESESPSDPVAGTPAGEPTPEGGS
jgi:hypothetical protein